MASTGHLHAETAVLPIRESLTLRCCQFLASALRPSHPSHSTVTSDSGPRPMKHTLQSRFGPLISHLTAGGTVDPANYSSILNTLHSEAVQQAILAAPANAVIGQQPPPIDPSETSLPRSQRSTLSQLRSGYCVRLRSYQHRIGTSPDSTCPDCGTDAQTVKHLFECPTFPTSLTPINLWTKPAEVISHLSQLDSFSFLLPPPLDPPQPTGPGPP